jgi:hypothetical protein
LLYWAQDEADKYVKKNNELLTELMREYDVPIGCGYIISTWDDPIRQICWDELTPRFPKIF